MFNPQQQKAIQRTLQNFNAVVKLTNVYTIIH